MRAMRCVWQSIRPGRTVARPSSMTFVFLGRSEEHTSELQSRLHLVCRLLLEKKKINLVATLMCPLLTDMPSVYFLQNYVLSVIQLCEEKSLFYDVRYQSC